MMLLDAGNIYSLKRGEEPEREAHFILDIMDEQKYDVAVLAAKDLEIPDSSLNRMIELSDFEWVGSDILPARRPKAVKPYVIRKIDGVKVGVFSWLDPEFRFNNVDSTEVLDNLEKVAKELRSKVDVLVLVAHTEERTIENVIKRVPEVDVVVLGGNTNPLFTERVYGRAVVGSPGDRGRHIGVFDLELNRAKKIVKSKYSVMVLDNNFPSNPVTTQKMDAFKKQAEDAKRASIEKKRLAKLAAMKRDPATLPGHDSPMTYVGDTECRACHTNVYAAWKTTTHSRAYTELIRARENDNEEKIPRHVTGYMEKGGFFDRIETPMLMNVQCEACHGRGSEHVKTKGAALETLNKTPANTCVTCHNPNDQPEFNLDAALKLVHDPASVVLPQNAAPVKGALPPEPKLPLGGKATGAGNTKPAGGH